MQFSSMTDPAIQAELAQRIRRGRLNQNITQARLALNAGVGRSVVQNLENGQDVTLSSLLRVLRSLGLIDQLNAFLPDPGISPIQLARLQGRKRQRASGLHDKKERPWPAPKK
ncbi:MAG TPA: helix-turn-helix domain-containing protein [Phycisphaerae bacterium]|jgi:transcriptional regulator with XRE-family HTH domain